MNVRNLDWFSSKYSEEDNQQHNYDEDGAELGSLGRYVSHAYVVGQILLHCSCLIHHQDTGSLLHNFHFMNVVVAVEHLSKSSFLVGQLGVFIVEIVCVEFWYAERYDDLG